MTNKLFHDHFLFGTAVVSHQVEVDKSNFERKPRKLAYWYVEISRTKNLTN